MRSGWRDRERTPRPDHAAGAPRRPAGDVRGDGRGAHSRGALGEHQGAPRRLDRAVRRPRADGHAGGGHPGPPRRDAGGRRGGPRRGPLGGALVGPQRPVQGRDAPPGHHRHHADPGRGRAVRLRRRSRPSRRRRRAGAGLDAGRQPHAGGGGRGHRAAAARRRGDRRTWRRACASPRSGGRTCAPSWRPTASGCGGSRSWPSGWAPARCEPPWTRSSTTPSGARAPAWPTCPTGPSRRATCSRPPRAISSCAWPPPWRATS